MRIDDGRDHKHRASRSDKFPDSEVPPRFSARNSAHHVWRTIVRMDRILPSGFPRELRFPPAIYGGVHDPHRSWAPALRLPGTKAVSRRAGVSRRACSALHPTGVSGRGDGSVFVVSLPDGIPALPRSKSRACGALFFASQAAHAKPVGRVALPSACDAVHVFAGQCRTHAGPGLNPLAGFARRRVCRSSSWPGVCRRHPGWAGTI